MKTLFGITVAITMAIAPFAYGATSHYGKTVGNIQVHPQNGCLYFTLNDVSEADPAIPGNAWFTVDPNSPGKNEVLSLLMLSYASGQTVKVVATGNKACGYAEAGTVRLEAKN